MLQSDVIPPIVPIPSSRRRPRRGGRAAALAVAAAVALAVAPPPAAAQGTASGPDADAPEAVVEGFVGAWTDLAAARDSVGSDAFTRRVDDLLDEAFSLDAMASAVLPDRWDELRPRQRDDLVGALRSSLRSRLLDRLEGRAPEAYPTLELVERDDEDGAAVLRYAVRGDRDDERLELHLRRGAGGSWAVHDVVYDGTEATERFRDRARGLVDDYSFPYMVAVLGDRRELVLEDFEDDPLGELPAGWHWRDRDEDKHKPYEVKEEDGNRYLAARDEGESVSLGKDVEWDLEEYPYLSFRVRVHEIPEGADERYDETVDSAAGVYVVYERKLFSLVPRSLKYVWSSTLPVGAATQRDGIGKPWQVVVGSGREGLGEWHTFVFDLRQAYRDTFGGDPPDEPVGIGLLSDANAVGGKAYADYDDFKLLRSVEGEPPGSGVEEILDP